MTKRTFYVYTNNIACTEDPNKLKTIIFTRTVPWCDAWSFENNAEANIFAIQHNHYKGYCNPDSQGALLLPTVGEYFIENPVAKTTIPMTNGKGYTYVIDTTAMQVSSNGIWCVDAINGYAVVKDLNELVYLLADSPFLYVHATWLSGDAVGSAINVARNLYIRCFYIRYNSQNERIVLPVNPMEQIYLDPSFDERERRYSRSSAMENLQAYGIF